MRTETRTAVLVWLALLALLAATLGGALLPLGAFSPVVSLGIALVKAGLILWFFMRLREEGSLVRLVAFGAAAWLLILLLLSSTDFLTRGAS